MSMIVVHVASGSRHSSLLGRMAEAMGRVLATLYTRQLGRKRGGGVSQAGPGASARRHLAHRRFVYL
jgi:hypothetical protein